MSSWFTRTNEVEDFIVEYFDKFEVGIQLDVLKNLYMNYFNSYDSRKFKKFQNELKEKMINNGEYRPRQLDGSRSRIYKLKEEFYELYKNENSDSLDFS